MQHWFSNANKGGKVLQRLEKERVGDAQNDRRGLGCGLAVCFGMHEGFELWIVNGKEGPVTKIILMHLNLTNMQIQLNL